MAYIRTYETKQKRSGKPVLVYRVCWREPARDLFGNKTGKLLAQQENYPTRGAAEARRDELNAARHTAMGTGGLAEARAKGAQPFGYYAQAWLDAQRLKVASGKAKSDTVDGYASRLAVYVLPEFGAKAIASITAVHCEQFLAALVARGLAPATLKHHWDVTRRVFKYALQHGAITANPCAAVDFAANSAVRRNKRHHPLTAEQVAAVASSVGERYPVYELLTLFAAYSGLRAEELAGLEVGDLVFAPGPRCSVKVRRAKKRQGGVWVTDTLKSARSARTVPLPDWLAAKLVDYLANTHERGTEPTAPLWPNRALGGARRRGCRAVAPLDFTEPVDPGAYYKNLLKPALEAVGLPASRPATTDTPAVEGVRLHDLRHTFAVLQLSAGKPFMQVSEWLGHATYSLTLDVYGGWIPKDDDAAANTLPEPTAPATNVVKLFEAKAN